MPWVFVRRTAIVVVAASSSLSLLRNLRCSSLRLPVPLSEELGNFKTEFIGKLEYTGTGTSGFCQPQLVLPRRVQTEAPDSRVREC